MSHATHSRSARLRAGLREHRAIAAVLAVAIVARAVVAVEYAPALFFPDSWSYVGAAYGESHLGGIRPPGYGLAIGLLVYGLVLRLGAGRALATVAAALVLLDGYAIALEQHILAETFCAAAMVASFALLSTARSAPATA